MGSTGLRKWHGGPSLIRAVTPPGVTRQTTYHYEGEAMAKTATRIYAVIDNNNPAATRLVRSTNPATARSHVVRERFSVEVAPQETLVNLLGEGVKVETATTDEAQA